MCQTDQTHFFFNSKKQKPAVEPFFQSILKHPSNRHHAARTTKMAIVVVGFVWTLWSKFTVRIIQWLSFWICWYFYSGKSLFDGKRRTVRLGFIEKKWHAHLSNWSRSTWIADQSKAFALTSVGQHGPFIMVARDFVLKFRFDGLIASWYRWSVKDSCHTAPFTTQQVRKTVFYGNPTGIKTTISEIHTSLEADILQV